MYEREVQTRPWTPESSVAGLELVVLHEGAGWQGATLSRGQAASGGVWRYPWHPALVFCIGR